MNNKRGTSNAVLGGLSFTMATIFKSFVRQAAKRRGYLVTHILSMTVGLTAAGFTLLYLQHELSFDSYHPGADQVFRISGQDASGWFAGLKRLHSDALRDKPIPEIDEIVRIRRWPYKFVHVGDQKFHGQKVLFTDPGSRFFTLFAFPFVAGNMTTVLENSHSVVIAESLAKNYFGRESALGKVIRLDSIQLTVTGVILDLPSNTHFDFDMMICHARAMDVASGHSVYARLHESTKPEDIAAKILALLVNTSPHQSLIDVRLINLKDLHYAGNMTYEMKVAGNVSYLWILGSIGLTILLIAITNYINLSVALYVSRSREIAVRKSIGATASKLTSQFFVESMGTILLAMVLSAVLIQLLTPYFSLLMDLRIHNPLTSPLLVLSLAGIGLVVAGLAAIYPVMVLPRIRILDLFRNSGITNQHGLQLRQILLTVQFIILFFVWCSLWVINQQFDFIMSRDLGFNKEGVLKLKRAWNIDSTRYWLLKTELKQNPAVQFVSEGYSPGDEDYGFTYRGENDTEVMPNLLIHSTDYEYLDVLGIRIVHSTVSIKENADLPSRACFINETLARQLGYDEPIGRKITIYAGESNERSVTIDGIVGDYNFESLHKPVGPQLLFLNGKSKWVDGTILIKVKTNALASVIAFIEKKARQVAPDEPIVVSFLEDDLEKLYQNESRLNIAVQVLIVVSVVLSFTGLLALCSYMVEFRLREVAIRKVMGAAAANIVKLFANVFVKVSLVSFVLGGSLSFIFLKSWMKGFAYRMGIEVDNFLIIFGIVITTTLLLVVGQTMRAVRANPTEVLKSE